MNRPRLMRPRRPAPHPMPPMPFLSEGDSAWLELGPSELRLRRESGEVTWSATLPDAALAGAEWAARDLAALDATGGAADDADPDDSEEVLLERS